MSLIRILLVLACASVTALAETNAPVVRKLSLEDCIEIALKHNFDVQIQRYNPEINRYALGAAYGSYDPTINLSIEHDYNQSAGGIDPQGRPFTGTETEVNLFSATIGGLLPWGTTYSLGATLTDTYGNKSVPSSGTNILGFVTNSFVALNNPTNRVDFITPIFNTVATRPEFEDFSGRIGLLQVRQPLLKNFWINPARLQILVDKNLLRSSELDLRNQVMNSVTDVERAYYDLIYDQENILVQQKALDLAERLVAENKKRVEVGALAPLDEKQAESQAAANRADLLAALGTEQTQQRKLRSLLSDDYSKWENVVIQPERVLVAVPESFNLQESWQKGLKQRPDILKQTLAVERQGYQVRFSRNQLFPELDLIGSAGLNASSANFNGYVDQLGGRDNPFYSIGGQLSIPLGRTTVRNNYKIAKATKEQLELQLKQLVQTALISIEDAIATAHTSFQRADATREARIYAEAALGAEQKKLESGKSTSFEVLRLQRDLTSARSAEIRALADYNIALTQIALSEGTTLERRHVTIEIK